MRAELIDPFGRRDPDRSFPILEDRRHVVARKSIRLRVVFGLAVDDPPQAGAEGADPQGARPIPEEALAVHDLLRRRNRLPPEPIGLEVILIARIPEHRIDMACRVPHDPRGPHWLVIGIVEATFPAIFGQAADSPLVERQDSAVRIRRRGNAGAAHRAIGDAPADDPIARDMANFIVRPAPSEVADPDRAVRVFKDGGWRRQPLLEEEEPAVPVSGQAIVDRKVESAVAGEQHIGNGMVGARAARPRLPALKPLAVEPVDAVLGAEQQISVRRLRDRERRRAQSVQADGPDPVRILGDRSLGIARTGRPRREPGCDEDGDRDELRERDAQSAERDRPSREHPLERVPPCVTVLQDRRSALMRFTIR
ncbi:MAG: hypothetical protein ACTHOJ_12730 [Sphingomonas oligoaromativorans]